MTLEEQIAKIVDLGWFPSLRMVGTTWPARPDRGRTSRSPPKRTTRRWRR